MEKMKDLLMLFASSFGDIVEFGLKALIIVIAFMICVKIVRKIRPPSSKKRLEIEDLKKKHEKYQDQFYTETLDKKELKLYLSEKAKAPPKKASWKDRLFILFKSKPAFSDSKASDSKQSHSKQLDTAPDSSKLKKPPVLFVLSFKGDIMATEVKNLREEISIVLNVAKEEDEVLLLLESRGGSVSHYGLAANQLQRIRDHKILLTVCVDRVAGSGGYLMACVGNKILAAPFAFIGSIGVLAGIPNIHELLQKHNISYEEFTAGKYKRTVTPLGKITEEKKERLKEQLQLIHVQFKNFVSKYRKINIEEVATGEAWLAESALKKGLVDELKCSDDYIREKIKSHSVYKISLKKEKTALEKLMDRRRDLPSQLLEELSKTDFFI